MFPQTYALPEQRTLRHVVPLLISEAIFIVVCLIFDYNYVFALVAGCGALVLIFASKEPVLALMGTAILTFSILWNIYEINVPVFFQDVFLALGLFVLLLQVIQGEPLQFRWSYLSRSVAFFCLAILTSGVLGLLYGRPVNLIAVEAHNLLYYVFFFIVLGMLKNSERGKFIARFALVAVALVGVQYVGIILERGTFGRVVSYNADFFVMALPMFVAMLFYERNKIVVLAGLLFVLAGLFISITRAEWAGAAIGSLAVVVLTIRDKKFGINAWLLLGAILVATTMIGIVMSAEISKAMQAVSRSEVGAKAGTLGRAFEDMSLLMRIELNFTAFKRFLEYPILGVGLGDVVRYRILTIGAPWSLDNSHLQVLWKMGILGFAAYAWLLLAVLKRSWFVFVRTSDRFFKWFSVGVLTGWIGTLALCFFSAALTKYNLNIMFALFLAVLESAALNLEERASKDTV